MPPRAATSSWTWVRKRGLMRGCSMVQRLRGDWARWLVLAALVVAVPGVIFRRLQTETGTWSAAFGGAWQFTLWVAVGSFVVALLLALWSGARRRSKLPQTLTAWEARDLGEVRELVHRVDASAAPLEERVPLLLDELLAGGLRLGASDVHVNPHSDGYRLNYRIDGRLEEVVSLESAVGRRLVGRVKVLADLELNPLSPQDGTLRRNWGSRSLEARVSSLPSHHGERLVLRLVQGDRRLPSLGELGLNRQVRSRLEDILLRPEGVLYVSGPVGSGKTTTLYAALQFLHQSRGDTTSLVTLEDPIEVQLPFLTQTQINTRASMTFAKTLRSVLRQDPGAMMVGEVRDEETAQIVTQAGLTGHLILTTLHVQSAAGVFPRMLEMGVEPFVLASSCAGSLAQRLVRALCLECREPAVPEDALVERFTRAGLQLAEREWFESRGCPECGGIGYQGRLPISELLIAHPNIIDAIIARRPLREIHDRARANGMQTLLESGLERARRGETSLSEVLRVAG